MRVKTFTGKTEEETLIKVKEELGEEAVVLNIKKINKKGFFNILNNSRVEIMAAVDNSQVKKSSNLENFKNIKIDNNSSLPNDDFSEKLKLAGKRIGNTESEIINEDFVIKEKEAVINQLNDKIKKSDELISTLTKDILELSDKGDIKQNSRFTNPYKEEAFNILLEQNVLEGIAISILSEIDDDIVTSLEVCKRLLYKKIIDIISEPEVININLYSRKREKVVFFMGPTGVGKTTTIAKLASKFILEENMVVGLITSDTYRIAAVEQLRTYAKILDIDLNVVYNKNDMISSYNNMINSKDLVFVDTAGRSHRNEENINELVELMNVVDESDKYLVLSLTTKSDDLIDIVQTYSKYFDFKILLTKADETITLGTVLNICYVTNKKVSYITNGQTVPNDIYLLEAESVAKSILGIEVV